MSTDDVFLILFGLMIGSGVLALLALLADYYTFLQENKDDHNHDR